MGVKFFIFLKHGSHVCCDHLKQAQVSLWQVSELEVCISYKTNEKANSVKLLGSCFFSPYEDESFLKPNLTC